MSTACGNPSRSRGPYGSVIYQRHLFYYRKKNGEPLTLRSQHSRLVPLRVWFKWMTRQNHILHNPASEIDLPRVGRTLPKNILSVQEIEQVMMQPNLADPLGLRDRAILEAIYASGLRRLEVMNLKLFDLQFDRGLIVVRQGKARKTATRRLVSARPHGFRSTSRKRGHRLPSNRTTSRRS
jgi:integrase/recombinase XerD